LDCTLILSSVVVDSDVRKTVVPVRGCLKPAMVRTSHPQLIRLPASLNRREFELINGKVGQAARNGMRPNWTNETLDGIDANEPKFGPSPAGRSRLFLGLDELSEVRVGARKPRRHDQSGKTHI